MQLPVEVTERIPEDFQRYKLLPTKGISKASCWAYAPSDDSRALRDFAEAFSVELGQSVLVLRYPEDGRRIQALFTVGEDPNEKKGRVR